MNLKMSYLNVLPKPMSIIVTKMSAKIYVFEVHDVAKITTYMRIELGNRMFIKDPSDKYVLELCNCVW